MKTIKEMYRQPGEYFGKTISLAAGFRAIGIPRPLGSLSSTMDPFKNIQIVFEEKSWKTTEIARLGSWHRKILVRFWLRRPMPNPLKSRQKASGRRPLVLDYPLQHSLSFAYHRYLRPRTNTFSAVFVYVPFCPMPFISFSGKGFYMCSTPIITGSDAEGAGEMFQVTTFDLRIIPVTEGRIDYKEDFFGRKPISP